AASTPAASRPTRCEARTRRLMASLLAQRSAELRPPCAQRRINPREERGADREPCTDHDGLRVELEAHRPAKRATIDHMDEQRGARAAAGLVRKTGRAAQPG